MSILEDVKLPCGEEHLLSFIAKPFEERRFAESIASAEGDFTKTKWVDQANFRKISKEMLDHGRSLSYRRSEF
jgi:hypothetical protein